MYKPLKVFFSVAGFSILTCASAQAGFSPLSINLFPPVEFPPSDFTITGARVSALWGHHKSVYGVDVGGIGNITDGPFGGIAVSGIFNVNHGQTNIIGLQAAGIANLSTEHLHVIGLQVAGAVNSGTAESTVVGVQLAPFANLCEHTSIYGFQIGLYNKAQDVYGFQIGLINSAQSLHGVQLGLVNFNKTGLFAVTPFINIGF